MSNKPDSIDRLHTTNSKTIIISGRKYPQTHDQVPYKPHGLWYSIGNDWFEWCQGEQFNGLGKFTFKLDLCLDKVLIIETDKVLVSFFETYKTQIFKEHYCVDWRKVALDYSGIEIRNYYALKWDNSLPALCTTWLYGWDVNSGCLWDLSIIKGFEKSKTDAKWFAERDLA